MHSAYPSQDFTKLTFPLHDTEARSTFSAKKAGEKNMAHVKLHGKEFHLEKQDILNVLRGGHPQPGQDFTISVHGKDYPIKQAISVVTGLSTEKFTGSEAHDFLRRLGFVIENYDHRRRKLQKGKHHRF